jgi:hypothetical protein
MAEKEFSREEKNYAQATPPPKKGFLKGIFSWGSKKESNV